MQEESLQLPNTAQSTWEENALGLDTLAESVLVMPSMYSFGFAVLGAGHGKDWKQFLSKIIYRRERRDRFHDMSEGLAAVKEGGRNGHLC